MNTPQQNLPPKPQAVSHMLWFFVFPSLLFLGWASYRFASGVLKPKPQDAFSKLAEVQGARNAGDRWQAAYGLAQALQKMSQDGTFTALDDAKKNELYEKLGQILKDHASDARLKKYLILTLSQLGDVRALPMLESGAQDPDPEIRFYSAWTLVELLIKNPASWNDKHVELALKWTHDADPALRKVGATFLVQDPRGDHKEALAPLLKDTDTQVRWNAAVALASKGDASAHSTLQEIFDLKKLRDAEIKSSEDLTRIVHAAWEAARKSGSQQLLSAGETLKKAANPETPEGRAILRAFN